MNGRAFALALLFMLISAFAHGQEENRAKRLSAPPAASVTYGLAETELALSFDLVIEACTDKGIAASTTLSLLPRVTRSAEVERLDAAALRSWLKKRDVAVALHDTGAIKSIGATTENRTAAVIGNIVKFAAAIATGGVVPLAGAPVRDNTICEDEVVRAYEAVDDYKNRISDLREALRTGGPAGDSAYASSYRRAGQSNFGFTHRAASRAVASSRPS